jgi:hypothetical protein
MLYEFDVTSPANTAASAPTEVLARLNKGLVTQVQVQIPPGAVGLARGQVWRGNSQIWPSNPGGYFKGDDLVLTWDEDYTLADEPLTLRLRVWNIDDTYPHTLTFRFALLGLAEAEERRGIAGLLRRVGEAILGRG